MLKPSPESFFLLPALVGIFFLRNEKNNAKEFNMAQSNKRVGEEVSIKACLSTQWYQACLSVYLEGLGNRALRSGYYLEVAELCTR